MSHSHAIALLAFSLDREIGVDVEWVRPEQADPAVARLLFSSAENAELESLSPAARVQAFFTCWTRKESYIKARGQGLSMPLRDFQVSVRPSSSPVLLRHAAEPAEDWRWSVRELLPGHDYVGAVAAEGLEWRLQTWQWANLLAPCTRSYANNHPTRAQHLYPNARSKPACWPD